MNHSLVSDGFKDDVLALRNYLGPVWLKFTRPSVNISRVYGHPSINYVEGYATFIRIFGLY
jgi:hypothetical protein